MSKHKKDEFQMTLDFLGSQDPAMNINYKKIVEDKIEKYEDEIKKLKIELKEVEKLNLENAKKIQEQDEKHIAQLEERNLMNVATVQTMARRHEEQIRDYRKYGGTKLAEDIIKPIDLFRKVLASPVASEEVKNYLIGFEMLSKQMQQALEDNGISQIPVKPGDKFDPTIHNANEAVESAECKPGEIVSVISNGYKLYERVIIHALVKVAK
ncbi:nucleotide exchange factor GrpE [Williamsoniiplasma lucivorax]|uniref:Protein GrpE n=1 Tax=Williamsoniiplasma lucivorax TaxID=209274 RepID=A0A2S5RD08_9MOLU|nr:nucleotide exchange factor GrpE [Williamsoniiplasma lucivorax]PPE05219.1 heat shock protein GrpE [Williamsoniiplasma lucivorax]